MPQYRKILIITDGPDRSADERALETRLSQYLRDGGHDVDICRSDQLEHYGRGADILIFNFPHNLPEIFERLRDTAVRLCNPHIPITIGVFPSGHSAGEMMGLDSILRSPAHPAQIRQRFDYLVRLRSADRELTSREQTLKQSFNIDISANNRSEIRNLHVLFIGKPHPAFLSIMSALEPQDVNIVAAFTSFSAFDYLHAEKFDAVILSGITNEEPALTIARTIRCNSQLFNLPAILLTSGSEAEFTERYADYGFNDIINAQSNAEEIAGRICEHAGGHLMAELLRDRFRSLDVADVTVPPSGLYKKSYFDAHLKRLRAIANAQDTPISVGVVSLTAKPGSTPSPLAFRAACVQIAGMIRNLVRLQDFPAQLSDSQFAIIFPQTSVDNCQIVLKRLTDVISATAFDDYGTSFTLHVDTDIVANRREEPLKQAIA